MIIKQASDLHFTYVRNTPELREAFINKCKEFGIRIFGFGGENYLEVYSDGYDEFEICGTDDLEPQSKKLTMSDLTGIPTETPEEKEVLDGIESAGEVEWKNGDLLEYANDAQFKRAWNGRYVCFDKKEGEHVIENGDGLWHAPSDCIRKLETQQEREDREKLEAAYDLYCVWVGDRAGYHAIDFDKWKVEPDFLNKWLRIVDKTNYRKEKLHGTN